MKSWITELLDGLPNEAKGPVVAGLFTLVAGGLTLLGVWLTLRSHRRREKENRLEIMRKEAYFEIAGAVATELRFASSLNDWALANADLSKPLAKFPEQEAKFSLVGDWDHLQMFCKFQLRLSELLAPILLKRNDMLTAKAKFDGVTRALESVIDRIKDEWDPEKHGQNPRIAAMQPILQTILDRHNEADKDVRRISAQISLEVRKALAELQPLLNDMLLSSRRVLGFAFSREVEDLYKQAMLEQRQRFSSIYEQQLRDLAGQQSQ